jgi:hypothetical protein
LRHRVLLPLVLAAVGLAAFAGLWPTREAAGPVEQRPSAEPSETAKLGFTGALDRDCKHAGRSAGGVEVFLSMCPRSAVSPDGRWRLVLVGEPETHVGPVPDYVFVEEASSGRRIGAVPGLSDGMPFSMFWSPQRDWFFVDHHVGSFMQVPEVFEIRADRIEKNDFLQAGMREARKRFPCLPTSDGWAAGNVMGWSADGRRMAWMLRTRIDVCMGPGDSGSIPRDKQVDPLMMVSDLASGGVVPGSVVFVSDRMLEKFEFPDTAAYRDIRRPQ